MRAAIILPVKNEARGLDELLSRLCAQAGPDDAVVVVDAGSTDATPDIVRRRAAADARVRLLVEPGAYPGRGRNIGIAATNAPIIAQIDGGNLPNAVWLDELLRPILEDRADHVTGNSLAMPVPWRAFGRAVDLGPVYQAAFLRLACLRRCDIRPDAAPGATDCPAGGDSVAFRRALWERCGGHPEWLRTGEDPVFVARLRQQSPRFAFAAKAVSWWQIGPSPADVWLRLVRQSQNLWRSPRSMRDNAPAIAASLGILASALLPLAASRLWPVPAALFAAYVYRQARKSLAAYRGIAAAEGRCSRLGAMVLAVLEVPFTLARLLGVAVGLASFGRHFDDHGPRVEAYLATGRNGHGR